MNRKHTILALVAARHEETAAEALSLIEVEYEPLPVIDTPEPPLAPRPISLLPTHCAPAAAASGRAMKNFRSSSR